MREQFLCLVINTSAGPTIIVVYGCRKCQRAGIDRNSTIIHLSYAKRCSTYTTRGAIERNTEKILRDTSPKREIHEVCGGQWRVARF